MEIKFLKYRKFKLAMIYLSVCAATFVAVYIITYNLIGIKSDVNFVNRNNYEIISKGDMRDIVVVGESSEGELYEKSRIKSKIADINKVFKEMYPIGRYEIINFDDNSIVLREITKSTFVPNMYYIGENNGYVAVFKSDDYGNLFIEDEKTDISGKKVDSLPVTDRELVTNYELKANERGDIQDILSELET